MIHITQSIETDVETDNYLSGFKYDFTFIYSVLFGRRLNVYYKLNYKYKI